MQRRDKSRTSKDKVEYLLFNLESTMNLKRYLILECKGVLTKLLKKSCPKKLESDPEEDKRIKENL